MSTERDDLSTETQSLIRLLAIGFVVGLGGLALIRSTRPSVLPMSVVPWLVGGVPVAAWSVTLALWLRAIRRRKAANLEPPGLYVLGVLFAALVTLGVLLLGVITGSISMASQISAALADPASRVYAFPGLNAAAVLAVGLALFAVRRRYRSTYGAVEVVIGVVVALTQTVDVLNSGRAIDGRFVLAMLTAGVYLVVRGLDNVDQGLEKTPSDPTARAMLWMAKQIRSTGAPETASTQAEVNAPSAIQSTGQCS